MNTTTNLSLQTYSNPNTDIFDPMVVEVPNMQKIDQFAGNTNGRFEELANTVNSAVETVQSMEDDVEQLQTDVGNKPNINNTTTSDTDTYSSRKIQELITNLNQLISTLTNQLANKQDTITGAGSSITENNLTTARVLISDGNGKVNTSPITSTQLSYLSGTTKNIEQRFNEIGTFTQLRGSTRTTTTPTSYTLASNINNFKQLYFELQNANDEVVDSLTVPVSLFKNHAGVYLKNISVEGGIGANLVHIHCDDDTHISVYSTGGWADNLFVYGHM